MTNPKKPFWDERYAGEQYAYGTQPNVFFKIQIDQLPAGKILLPAEGEGRNAVYAATRGWEVVAFDQSPVAAQKTEALAKQHGVKINYSIADQEKFFSHENHFDCIALIFVHMPAGVRNDFHKRMIRYLKPGGKLILEGFEKSQIHNNSGGPKQVDMLFSKEELINDFDSLTHLDISKQEIILDEGIYHKGASHVIRLTGSKSD